MNVNMASIDANASLYTKCLNYVCHHLELLCEYKTTTTTTTINQKSVKKFQFKDKSSKFNHIISEDLFERLNELGKLNDKTIDLFTNSQTSLKRLKIKNAILSKESIKQILKQHQINEILFNNILFEKEISSSNIINGNTITINELLDSLNDWSLENLKSLNVSRNISLFGSILTSFKHFKYLLKLNVSQTSFSNQSLDIVTQYLTNLEYLDISVTRVNDLSTLLRLKDKLKYLSMYNMRNSFNDDIIDVVCSLAKLKNLDLSCDVSTKIFADSTLSMFDVNLLLDKISLSNLDNLIYLDISGKVSIKQESIIYFIKSYPELKFIGLALTNANSFEIFNTNNNLLPISFDSASITQPDYTKKNLIVTGESNEIQLLASLKYYKFRQNYIQKSLYHLFELSKNFKQTRVDLIELIIELMRLHNKSQSVQLAATTCIFNLTRQELHKNVPNMLLSQTVSVIINSMQIYPSTAILQKNCLLILNNEEILSRAIFNCFDCIKVLLECIKNHNDILILNNAILICAIVANKADNKYRKQFKKLTDPKYIMKLLNIISSKIEASTEDMILQSTLIILNTLSEDNKEWCCNFVTHNGLNIYASLINTFENNSEIITKSSSLIYKLSEIGQIRPIIFNHPILNAIKTQLYHEKLKISFLAVGIFVNLLVYMPESDWDWKDTIISSQKAIEFRQNIIQIIDKWGYDLQLNIRFSFSSQDLFSKLINMNSEPFAQMWSLWALYNNFQLNFSNQIHSNENLKIIELIQSVMNDRKTDPKIIYQSSIIIKMLENTKNISLC